jgi:hypothetical protein
MNSAADIRKMAEAGHVTDQDVLALRRAMYGNDHVIDKAEAEALFRLNDVADGTCVAWPDFFVEAITDYCVHQIEPAGYVSEDNADWLIGMISHSGRVKTPTELELLLKVMETARETPASLERFAMNQVREAVMTGEGPVHRGSDLKPGQIGEAEVSLIRRILYASAGADGAAISRAEAEMLFDLNDAVSGKDNHPSWRALFVNAIANYLMAARVSAAPGREEALRRDKWLDSGNAGVMGILSQALSSGLRGFSSGNWQEVMNARQSLAAQRHNQFVTDTATSEIVNAEEAEWLASRINRDGHLHDAEKALLEFIKRESPDVHPSLQPLLDRVA